MKRQRLLEVIKRPSRHVATHAIVPLSKSYSNTIAFNTTIINFLIIDSIPCLKFLHISCQHPHWAVIGLTSLVLRSPQKYRFRYLKRSVPRYDVIIRIKDNQLWKFSVSRYNVVIRIKDNQLWKFSVPRYNVVIRVRGAQIRRFPCPLWWWTFLGKASLSSRLKRCPTRNFNKGYPLRWLTKIYLQKYIP